MLLRYPELLPLLCVALLAVLCFWEDYKMAKSDLVDVIVGLEHETPNAWLVNDGKVKVWVAKSQAELELSHGGRFYTLTLPERLAIEKGLV